jgi:leucyl-tRNA synthetase
VNGKHRGELNVPADSTEEEIVRLASTNPKVIPHLGSNPLKRSIYVKGRLVNLIA